MNNLFTFIKKIVKLLLIFSTINFDLSFIVSGEFMLQINGFLFRNKKGISTKLGTISLVEKNTALFRPFSFHYFFFFFFFFFGTFFPTQIILLSVVEHRSFYHIKVIDESQPR
jgi:hypothetical protein